MSQQRQHRYRVEDNSDSVKNGNSHGHKKHAKNKGKKRLIIAGALAVLIVCAGLLVVNLVSEVRERLFESQYQLQYTEYVDKYSEEYDVDKVLIYSIINTESHFDPNAESAVGAIGLMQIMPDTFTWLQTYSGADEVLDSSALYDPETNIKYGVMFLDYLVDMYDSRSAVAAAYNAGFVVSEWLENPEYSDDGVNLKTTPYAQTTAYIEKVESAYEMYSKLYFSTDETK